MKNKIDVAMAVCLIVALWFLLTYKKAAEDWKKNARDWQSFSQHFEQTTHKWKAIAGEWEKACTNAMAEVIEIQKAESKAIALFEESNHGCGLEIDYWGDNSNPPDYVCLWNHVFYSGWDGFWPVADYPPPKDPPSTAEPPSKKESEPPKKPKSIFEDKDKTLYEQDADVRWIVTSGTNQTSYTNFWLFRMTTRNRGNTPIGSASFRPRVTPGARTGARIPSIESFSSITVQAGTRRLPSSWACDVMACWCGGPSNERTLEPALRIRTALARRAAYLRACKPSRIQDHGGTEPVSHAQRSFRACDGDLAMRFLPAFPRPHGRAGSLWRNIWNRKIDSIAPPH